MNPIKSNELMAQERILLEAIRNPTKFAYQMRQDEKKSIDWFVNRLRKVRAKENKHFSGGAGSGNSSPMIGHMYLFSYDPKTKDRLPYWDAHPLVIPIEYYNDGFLGLNLHYLHPMMRAKLLQVLIHNYAVAGPHIQYLRVSYDQLKSLSKTVHVKSTVKRYLYSHMRQRFQRIPPTEWTNAIMLPLQKFVGASATAVWRKSE